MNRIPFGSSLPFRFLGVASVLLFAACQDLQTVTGPDSPVAAAVTSSPQAARAQFNRSVPAVLELPGTVFGDLDEATGQLVFGVENEGVTRGVQNVLRRLGVPASSYSIRVVEPIRFVSSLPLPSLLEDPVPTLQDKVDPRIGGLQIHFSNFLCTLGFSADHESGERSFVTASHCSDTQGATDGTAYFQPLSSVDDKPIAFEVDDPPYLKRVVLGGVLCSRGKKCRLSDATRARYEDGVESLGEIARTSGANSGSLAIMGTFDVTSQAARDEKVFSGPLNKVGRSTGWTQGEVIHSCARVNVFGSNIQLICQTIVREPNKIIVGSGDSGSPVFEITSTGTESPTAELVGILWGSQGSDTFIFSPLSGIVDELGALVATTDGTGTGDPSNNAPTARFTWSAIGLTVDFTDTSSDPDEEDVLTWVWNLGGPGVFGDGQSSTSQNPTYTYAASGTYTVTLTVTDGNGGSDAATSEVTVIDGSGSELALTVMGRTNRGSRTFADLLWTGGTTVTVDIYRGGSVVATVDNTGSYTDKLGRGTGPFLYQVCEPGSSTLTCSNEVVVTF